jgi:hypothetical protein
MILNILLIVKTLFFQVLASVSERNSIILYLRDAEKLLLQSQRMYSLFEKMLKKLSGNVLILGSRMLDQEDDCKEVDERLALLFPYNIEIKPPEDETHLVSWKAQLEEDMKKIQIQDTKNHIAEVLAANDIECDDLSSICHADTMVLSNYIEEIVVSAISYHLMNNKDPEYRNGKLVISSKRWILFFFFFFVISSGKIVENNLLLTILSLEQLVTWIEYIPRR